MEQGAVNLMNGSSAKVFVSVPNRNGICQGAASALFSAYRNGLASSTIHAIHFESTTLLCQTFNRCWCAALNARPAITHQAMMHDDQEPEHTWLNTLLAEQRRCGADVLSVVIPIKNERGLTSTGVLDPRTRKMRRFTMKEIARMPQTFDAAGAGCPGQILLVNTGLWICDFTKPWVEKIRFTVLDRILQAPDGRWFPQSFSEDWNFSIDCARLGLKVMATTAVKLRHHGDMGFPNFAAWGEWETDRATEDYWRPAVEDNVADQMPLPQYEKTLVKQST